MAHRLTADMNRPTELMCVIEHAASALRGGELIVVPTDTVYGLACAVSDEQAARRVYELKRRDPRNPLPVLVPWPRGRQGDNDRRGTGPRPTRTTEQPTQDDDNDRRGTGPRPTRTTEQRRQADDNGRDEMGARSRGTAALRRVAETDTEGFEALADQFWPGPLTIIVPASKNIAETVVAGGPSVGVRAPDHPVTLRLLEHFGPIAATSANLSGHPPAETVDDLDPNFIEGVSVIIDAGPCPLGEASTVIDLTLPHPAVLRDGPITCEQLQRVLGRTVRSTNVFRED